MSRRINKSKRRVKRRFGSKKRSSKKSKRSSKKSKRSKRSSKKRRSSRRKRFGRMTNLSGIMGNYQPGQEMSTFQQYTGMPPGQMKQHLAGIPMNLRSNFYTNLFGRSKSRTMRRKRRSRRRSFGRMSNLSNTMGNYQPGQGMSTFQQYTGMSPGQMAGHVGGIPMSDRSNFYTNLFGRKRRRSKRTKSKRRRSRK
jgi:hypothetical protein